MKRLMDIIGKNQKAVDFIRENRDMLVKVAAAIAVVVVAFLIFVSKGEEANDVVIEDSDMAAEAETAAVRVCVDIGGAVKKPMVAELDEGSRVEDAIEAAGGLTENADITDINRAAFVEDGDKIYIPYLMESEEDDAAAYQDGTGYTGYYDGKININTADSEQLQELSGVGPATAEKIISYREENGRFRSIEDIKNVSGIGDKTFEKFRDKIKV